MVKCGGYYHGSETADQGQAKAKRGNPSGTFIRCHLETLQETPPRPTFNFENILNLEAPNISVVKSSENWETILNKDL
jgi:hypothetical protein